MCAIFKREIKCYFLSAIGYVFLAAFYLLNGWFFYQGSLLQNRADLKYVFGSLLTILIFFIPILTMKLMSEDKKLKTDQALLTAPINLFSIVFGKFLAAFVMLCCAVFITLIYAITISYFAHYDWLTYISNIIGFLLLGSSLISIGIFISSLTENQVISAVSSFAVMLLIFFMDGISASIKNPILSNIISHLSITTPYQQFTFGMFSLPNVVLFFSITCVFLFLTSRILEKRRWSN